MARSQAKLRSVAPAAPAPEPSLAYEWQERQRIARKDWAAIHIHADRARPFDFVRRIARHWR